MKERTKPQQGFSLIEVLVALALVSVIVLAVMGLVIAGMQRSYGGKKMTEAAVLAQAVMERINRPAAQDLFLGHATAAASTSDRSLTWTNAGAVTPAAEAVGTAGAVERNIWRTLFANAPLPTTGTAATQSFMTVRMEAVPAGTTFATAAMVRITVDVRWSERGNRSRLVRLQNLNRPAA